VGRVVGGFGRGHSGAALAHRGMTSQPVENGPLFGPDRPACRGLSVIDGHLRS
jgi:hypothetical protein